jgi:exopolyphosphatase/guanosine-5'-triphosphate,3'-diphosphate pyrophosphatase
VVVAEVNPQTGAVQILHEEAAAVGYQMDLERNATGSFSAEVQNLGIVALARLKGVAMEKGATEFAGVATAAFRNAKNGAEFARFLGKIFGIRLQVIEHEQEAWIGFQAAVRGEDRRPRDIVVWDIGAASMQLMSVDSEGRPNIYLGKLASVSFANCIIEQIQGKSLQQISSPNPISREEAEKAMARARCAAKEIPKSLAQKLASPDTLVLGIGGVHYYSVRNQLNMGHVYTREALRTTLEARLGMTDQQIGGEYAATEVANLALVLAFMEELGIRSVKARRINMAHAMLLSSSLWE